MQDKIPPACAQGTVKADSLSLGWGSGAWRPLEPRSAPAAQREGDRTSRALGGPPDRRQTRAGLESGARTPGQPCARLSHTRCSGPTPHRLKPPPHLCFVPTQGPPQTPGEDIPPPVLSEACCTALTATRVTPSTHSLLLVTHWPNPDVSGKASPGHPWLLRGHWGPRPCPGRKPRLERGSVLSPTPHAGYQPCPARTGFLQKPTVHPFRPGPRDNLLREDSNLRQTAPVTWLLHPPVTSGPLLGDRTPPNRPARPRGSGSPSPRRE